jgi:hypothetical protein
MGRANRRIKFGLFSLVVIASLSFNSAIRFATEEHQPSMKLRLGKRMKHRNGRELSVYL